MPFLHDLPPELIDQIHHHLEDLLIDGLPPAEQVGIAEDLGRFRLVSSYIQRATRRSFLKTWFAAWTIEAPDDASIDEFCTMAKIPDLAKAITEISFLVDDDYTMRVQDRELNLVLVASIQQLVLGGDGDYCPKAHQGNLSTSATHVHDDVTGVLVPIAYHRNRCALEKAFRACGNVTTLRFGNVPVDLERRWQYKRESWWHGSEPGSGDEDDEDDEDGFEDEADHESGDEEIEDHTEMDEPGQEDDEETDEEYENSRRENRNILVDASSSCFYVLFLAGQAGMCPKNINTFHRCTGHPLCCVDLGLTDCTGLVRAKSAMTKLESLKLDFIEDKYGAGRTSEKSGVRLGHQIREGLAHMPMLKHLSLNFEFWSLESAWSVLAKAPAIPTLQTLEVGEGAINMRDFTEFLGKHSANLTSLAIRRLHLTNGGLGDVGTLYKTLSQAPQIEDSYQKGLYLGLPQEDFIDYPSGVCLAICGEDEDEDGFVRVHHTEWIHWKGHDDVTRVLGEMARFLLPE